MKWPCIQRQREYVRLTNRRWENMEACSLSLPWSLCTRCWSIFIQPRTLSSFITWHIIKDASQFYRQASYSWAHIQQRGIEERENTHVSSLSSTHRARLLAGPINPDGGTSTILHVYIPNLYGINQNWPSEYICIHAVHNCTKPNSEFPTRCQKMEQSIAEVKFSFKK